MKRIWIVCAALFLALLLTGCTENEIACGLDADNTAYLRLELHFDLTGLEGDLRSQVRGGLRRIETDYAYDRGFTCQTNWGDNSDHVDMVFERRESAQDLAQGIEALNTLLTDPKRTPFTAAGADLHETENASAARLEVRLESGRVLDTMALDSFPKTLQAQIRDALDRAGLSLRLTLPASELPEGEQAECKDGLAVKTAHAALTDPELTLSLSTVTTTSAPQTGDERLSELSALAREQTRRRNAAFLACGILTALALLLFITGSVRAYHKHKNHGGM